jgi:hypothetical protein
VAQLRVYVGAVVGCASDSIGGAQLGRCCGSVGEMWWLSCGYMLVQL